MNDDLEDNEFDLVRMDRTRTADTVFPPEKGAHFLQDGLHFGADGRLALEWLSESDKARVRRKVLRAKAEDVANRARREALKKAGIDPDAKDDDGLETPRTSVKKAATSLEGAIDPNAVDLKAWARGETKVSWFKVRQAFIAQHSKEVENKEDALIFLADEGLISGEEVGV